MQSGRRGSADADMAAESGLLRQFSMLQFDGQYRGKLRKRLTKDKLYRGFYDDKLIIIIILISFDEQLGIIFLSKIQDHALIK
jgi:hypothetical protein